MKKSFIDSSEFDDEGEMRPSFVAEVLRRMREEKPILTEEGFERLLSDDEPIAFIADMRAADKSVGTMSHTEFWSKVL